MENKNNSTEARRLDLDELDNISGGTYQEAMEYLDYLMWGHHWESRTYAIKHMSDEEYAHYVELLDN